MACCNEDVAGCLDKDRNFIAFLSVNLLQYLFIDCYPLQRRTAPRRECPGKVQHSPAMLSRHRPVPSTRQQPHHHPAPLSPPVGFAGAFFAHQFASSLFPTPLWSYVPLSGCHSVALGGWLCETG